jgi:deoxyuridine 5'-triphosphate nucleotidohydrolase
MELKVKRLTETARLPEKAHTGDLGYDVFADEDKWIPYGEYRLISTGISVFNNTYKYGFVIKDRSSIAMKGLFTHAGVIDAGYTGEIKIFFHNVSSTSIKLEKGDKIAQLIPTKVINFEIEEVEELFKTKRGNDGFGSTGK